MYHNISELISVLSNDAQSALASPLVSVHIDGVWAGGFAGDPNLVALAVASDESPIVVGVAVAP